MARYRAIWYAVDYGRPGWFRHNDNHHNSDDLPHLTDQHRSRIRSASPHQHQRLDGSGCARVRGLPRRENVDGCDQRLIVSPAVDPQR